MFPRWPILTAGFIAPLLWTGLALLGARHRQPHPQRAHRLVLVHPSQIAFGLVCGFVVNLQTKVRTPQFQALPFAVRAGLHASEQVDENNSSEGLK